MECEITEAYRAYRLSTFPIHSQKRLVYCWYHLPQKMNKKCLQTYIGNKHIHTYATKRFLRNIIDSKIPLEEIYVSPQGA